MTKRSDKEVTNGDMFNQFIETLQSRQQEYDEETKEQLAEIVCFNWDTNRYLKEILWELRYARRRADRP